MYFICGADGCGFYDGLGYSRTIDDAFEMGRNAILWKLLSFSSTTRKLIPVDFEIVESTQTLPEDLKPILLKKAVNSFSSISSSVEQNIQNAPNSTNINTLQQYRERVKEFLGERVLTPIEKFQLATLAKQLEISESEANEIVLEDCC